MSPRNRRLGQLSALIALMTLACPVLADDDERGERHERNHHRPDQLREAVERGDIKPLSDVLRIVQPKLPGEIVGAEAEYKTGRWIYEFRVLNLQSHLFEAHVDAATATITQEANTVRARPWLASKAARPASRQRRPPPRPRRLW